MLKNLRTQSALRHFMVLLYLAGALFFQNFHEHSAGFFLRDFHFKNSAASVKFNKERPADTDCAACSLHYAGSVLLPQQPAVEFYTGTSYSEKVFCGSPQPLEKPLPTLYLRGPPVLI